MCPHSSPRTSRTGPTRRSRLNGSRSATSGHRGSSLDTTFNEWHIYAIAQAICLYRTAHQIDGPMFLGMDTHALSGPALTSALEVLAANGVDVMLSANDEFTPTPAVSHAILVYNRNRTRGLADGIVITPSHNPPRDGASSTTPTNGGPAEPAVTRWIARTSQRSADEPPAGRETHGVRSGASRVHDTSSRLSGCVPSGISIRSSTWR